MTPTESIMLDLDAVFNKHARKNRLFNITGSFHLGKPGAKHIDFEIILDDEGNQYSTYTPRAREKTLKTS